MGFGSVVAACTSASPRQRSLGELIRSGYYRKFDVPPPCLDTFFYRVSSLAHLCPRQEVLCARSGVTRTVLQETNALATFSLGSGVHFAMQNEILPAVGVLLGSWRCQSCGWLMGAKEKARAVVDVAIKRPSVCASCGEPGPFLYEEYFLQDDDIGTGGHPDGLLALPGREGVGVLEVKTIAQSGAKEVRDNPKLSHIVQIQMYMNLLRAKWGIIFYWIKGIYGTEKAWVEHTVESDPELVKNVRTMLQSIKIGLRGGPLPYGICTSRRSPTADGCPVASACFAAGDPTGGTRVTAIF